MALRIVGAGMAGLIAANWFRKATPVVVERQQSLPHNHRALLRFRTSDVSTVTGVPFDRVYVRKELRSGGEMVHEPTIAMSNSYSYKVTGQIQARSVWNLKNEHRFIAPADFVSQLAQGVFCVYDTEVRLTDLQERIDPVISTIPMPSLMKLVGWNDIPEFRYRHIWAVNAQIVAPIVNVFQTIYYPDLDLPIYRASITGSELILEFVYEPDDIDRWIAMSCNDFGLPSDTVAFAEEPKCTLQEYGKIVPIDEDVRQEFIYSMSRDYGIYSLGRYSTWRQIQLDDLCDDLRVIERLMNAESRRRRYRHALEATR